MDLNENTLALFAFLRRRFVHSALALERTSQERSTDLDRGKELIVMMTGITTKTKRTRTAREHQQQYQPRTRRHSFTKDNKNRHWYSTISNAAIHTAG
jgi:hypothetical protein